MSNITREYALELANLYGIKVNENSKEHLVEDINGNITELKEQDISEIFGIDFEDNISDIYIIRNITTSILNIKRCRI